MLVKSGSLPYEVAHAFEFKWDGMRAIVTLDRGRVNVQSRNGRDFTAHYPELQALADATRGYRLRLDGEIIAPGPDGRPSFELLGTRIRSKPRVSTYCGPPICLMLFDVMNVNGRDAMRGAYAQRRRVLEDLNPTARTGRRQRTSSATANIFAPCHASIALKESWRSAWTAVMKRESAPVPGERSRITAPAFTGLAVGFLATTGAWTLCSSESRPAPGVCSTLARWSWGRSGG